MILINVASSNKKDLSTLPGIRKLLDIREIMSLRKSIRIGLTGLALLSLVGLGGILIGCENNISVNQTPSVNETRIEKLYGLCYDPFRDNEDPDKGIYPTKQEMEEDMSLISKLTSLVRTYGVDGTLYDIPEICKEYNVDCYPGAWLGEDYKENEKYIQSLIQIAQERNDSVKGLVVGTEVLSDGTLSEQELIDYIQRVKSGVNATGIPVSYDEEWDALLQHPKVVESVDLVLVNIYPYWDGIDIDHAAQYVIDTYYRMKQAFPGKEIIIGETGWPTDGNIIEDAVPSEGNQKKFLTDFTKLANQDNIPYLFFELFDEKLNVQDEGEVGAHWGLYESNGSLKQPLIGILPESGVVR